MTTKKEQKKGQKTKGQNWTTIDIHGAEEKESTSLKKKKKTKNRKARGGYKIVEVNDQWIVLSFFHMRCNM